jgi:hypothetical protein
MNFKHKLKTENANLQLSTYNSLAIGPAGSTVITNLTTKPYSELEQ